MAIILSDTAKRRASEVGLTPQKAMSIAERAYKQRSQTSIQGVAGKFVASVRRQHNGADVRVRDGYVFAFNGGIVSMIYRMPEIQAKGKIQ